MKHFPLYPNPSLFSPQAVPQEQMQAQGGGYGAGGGYGSYGYPPAGGRGGRGGARGGAGGAMGGYGAPAYGYGGYDQGYVEERLFFDLE